MATEFCPECHQPMIEVVAGVRLPVFKARLFYFIRSQPGRSGKELAQRFERSPNTIKAHIHQINDAMMLTRFQIHGGKFTGYYIENNGDLPRNKNP